MKTETLNGFCQRDIIKMYKLAMRYQELCDNNIHKAIAIPGLCNIVKMSKKLHKTISKLMQNPISGTFYMTNKACDSTFVGHLRNSFAHGRIKNEKGYVTIIDVSPDDHQITMYGRLPYDDFKALITLILNSI